MNLRCFLLSLAEDKVAFSFGSRANIKLSAERTRGPGRVAVQRRPSYNTVVLFGSGYEVAGPLSDCILIFYHQHILREQRQHGRRRGGASAAVHPATHRRFEAITGWPVALSTQTKWCCRQSKTTTASSTEAWRSCETNWIYSPSFDEQSTTSRQWRSREQCNHRQPARLFPSRCCVCKWYGWYLTT